MLLVVVVIVVITCGVLHMRMIVTRGGLSLNVSLIHRSNSVHSFRAS